jgi:prepilin-type N-terminal cleavage/methylation domain-containing protein
MPAPDHSPAPLHARRHCAGFSLMELLLAAALGAVLVTATATMTGSFGMTVAQLETDSVDSYEAALARITRDVRYAWWVEVPSSSSLRIADSDGDVTEYFGVGNSLLVRRPDGAQGAVITGLASLAFEAQTAQRLREETPVTLNRRLSGVAAPASLSSSYLLDAETSLALAFEVSSNAGPLTVPGVDDRVRSHLPNRLDVRVARQNNLGSLRVEVYEARAPGDARPRPGSTALCAFNIPTNLLPVGSGILAPAAVQSLAIPSMTGRLKPGVAYSIVLSAAGSARLYVGRWLSLAGASRSVLIKGTAADAHDNPGAWANQSFVVPFGVYGEISLTTTTATDVVEQVRISMGTSSGAEHLGSACVSTQVLADDPWLGVIPCETPALP